MSGLLDDCRELFQTDDLYKVLGVKKSASNSDVKRGYHRMSLKVHPDRVAPEEKEIATRKFQALGKAYTILSDKDKRAAYDETGEVDDENDIPQDRDWFDYWRLLYKKVSLEDIKEFEAKYKDSEEELEDLKSAYCDFEGDMDEILENVLCATVDDEPRFREILEGLVKEKELPKFKAFTNEKKSKKTDRKRRADEEAAEAQVAAEELGIKDGDSLRNLIMKKNQSRENAADDFFGQLEAKYAKPKGKKSQKGKAKP